MTRNNKQSDLATAEVLVLAAVFWVVMIFISPACSGDIEHEVTGSTNHNVEISEKFCDREAYPNAAERRACKDALLEAMKCHEEK